VDPLVSTWAAGAGVSQYTPASPRLLWPGLGARTPSSRLWRGFLEVDGELDEEDIPVDVSKFILRKRDMLLLCSDGVSDVLSNDEIYIALYKNDNILDACKCLFERVHVSAIDNISMILMQCEAEIECR
jgi:hypothetical protein